MAKSQMTETLPGKQYDLEKRTCEFAGCVRAFVKMIIGQERLSNADPDFEKRIEGDAISVWKI